MCIITNTKQPVCSKNNVRSWCSCSCRAALDGNSHMLSCSTRLCLPRVQVTVLQSLCTQRLLLWTEVLLKRHRNYVFWFFRPTRKMPSQCPLQKLSEKSEMQRGKSFHFLFCTWVFCSGLVIDCSTRVLHVRRQFFALNMCLDNTGLSPDILLSLRLQMQPFFWPAFVNHCHKQS